MDSRKRIDHTGIVSAVKAHTADVVIRNLSACASCHASTTCGMTESVSKTITARLPEFEIKAGDTVTVEASLGQGIFAVIIAYCIPAVLAVAIIVAGSFMNMDERVSAGIAIAVMVPYFFVLYLLRNRIGRRISFEITKKINHQ